MDADEMEFADDPPEPAARYVGRQVRKIAVLKANPGKWTKFHTAVNERAAFTYAFNLRSKGCLATCRGTVVWASWPNGKATNGD